MVLQSKLTNKLSITYAASLVFNITIGIFAISRLGDIQHAAESRNIIIGLMAASAVIGGWLNYFIVFVLFIDPHGGRSKHLKPLPTEIFPRI